MSALTKVCELVKANLADDHNVDGVRFIDDLLLVVPEAGKIKCTLAGNRALRFEVPDEPPCEVEIGRAKSKLRLLCARLATLCQETGQDVSIYGGEGTVANTRSIRFRNTTDQQEFVIT